MTQEEQASLVSGQQAAATDATKDEKTIDEVEQDNKEQTGQEQQATTGGAQEQIQKIWADLFKFKRLSFRKLSPSAKACKLARQSAAQALKSSRAAAVAAENAARCAEAAQAAALACQAEVESLTEPKKEADAKDVKAEQPEAAKLEEVAAK